MEHELMLLLHGHDLHISDFMEVKEGSGEEEAAGAWMGVGGAHRP
jgi:hypothetical protein